MINTDDPVLAIVRGSPGKHLDALAKVLPDFSFLAPTTEEALAKPFHTRKALHHEARELLRQNRMVLLADVFASQRSIGNALRSAMKVGARVIIIECPFQDLSRVGSVTYSLRFHVPVVDYTCLLDSRASQDDVKTFARYPATLTPHPPSKVATEEGAGDMHQVATEVNRRAHAETYNDLQAFVPASQKHELSRLGVGITTDNGERILAWIYRNPFLGTASWTLVGVTKEVGRDLAGLPGRIKARELALREATLRAIEEEQDVEAREALQRDYAEGLLHRVGDRPSLDIQPEDIDANEAFAFLLEGDRQNAFVGFPEPAHISDTVSQILEIMDLLSAGAIGDGGQACLERAVLTRREMYGLRLRPAPSKLPIL